MPQTTEQIEDFLNKLDCDDDFRDKLKNDPGTILDQYDIPYRSGELPAPEDIELPPKGEVSAYYQTYKDTLFPDNEFARQEHRLDLDVGESNN